MCDGTKSELERRIEETYVTKVEFEQRWATLARDNHQFIDAYDRYLRDAENRIALLVERMELMMDSSKENARLRAKMQDDMRETLENHGERLNAIEIILGKMQQEQSNFYDFLYGNTNRPDAPPSIVSLIKARSVESERQQKEILEAINSYNERLEDVEVFVKNIRRIAFAGNKYIVRFGKFLLKTLIGRIITALASVYVAARAIDPAAVDSFVNSIVDAFVRLFTGS